MSICPATRDNTVWSPCKQQLWGEKSLEIFSHNSFLKYATVTSFFLLVLLIYQNDWKKGWSTFLRWTFKKEDGSEDAPNMLFWIMLTDLNRNKKITSAFNAPGMNVIGRSSGPVGPVNNMKCVWNEPRDVFRTRSSLYHTNSHLIRPSSRQRFGFTSKKQPRVVYGCAPAPWL